MIHNIVCPSCGAAAGVTKAIEIDVHFRDDGIACGASGKSARRAVRAAITADIRQFRREIEKTQRLLAGAEKKLATLDKIGGAR
jgi:hypothetical protein